jgi:hypothetical protein
VSNPKKNANTPISKPIAKTEKGEGFHQTISDVRHRFCQIKPDSADLFKGPPKQAEPQEIMDPPYPLGDPWIEAILSLKMVLIRDYNED